MNAPLATIGIAVRSRQDNPWLDRLLASLQRHASGLPQTDVLIEEAPFLCRVEKLNRLIREARGRYLCLLEDDAEVLHPGWLAGMLVGAQVCNGIAIAGPLEAGPGLLEEHAMDVLRPGACEVSNLPGFCLLLDREAGLLFDVRCGTMPDLEISLQARAAGFRLAKVNTAVVRHTKEPFGQDAVPPERQADRSRFGEGDAYYKKRTHDANRLRDAGLLLGMYGDLARMTLPKELLSVLEPEATEWHNLQPGCWVCRQQVAPGAEWIMTDNGPECFPCREGRTAEQAA